MPYTTLVAGTTITASWANANVRDQAVTPFATAAARSSAITSPIAGMLTWRTDGPGFEGYNGAQYVPLYPSAANVDTNQNTTSVTYVDLGTVGPAVTVVTGTTALVWVGAYMNNSGANNSYIGVAVSGASTVAAADAAAASNVGTNAVSSSGMFKVTGLTAGSNTFTAKYRVSAGTGNFVFRNIVVWPLFS